MPTIIIKNTTTPGCAPSAADLAIGELAINAADGTLFLKKMSGEVVSVGGIDTDCANKVVCGIIDGGNA